jgi:hypothetical protein
VCGIRERDRGSPNRATTPRTLNILFRKRLSIEDFCFEMESFLLSEYEFRGAKVSLSYILYRGAMSLTSNFIEEIK